MKNVVILTSSLTYGGAERIVGLLSKYLSKIYNVYLCICDCTTITYDYGGTLVDLSKNGNDKIEQTLRTVKQEYQIDCSISFLVDMDILNIRTRQRESVIISNRNSYGERGDCVYSTIHKIRKWYGKADKIVSCAYGVTYDMVHNFELDENIITTIYNFIDKEKIAKNSENHVQDYVMDFVGTSKLLLNVGRLANEKNHHKLLTQFSKLIYEGYDVKLIILGSGSLESELKKYTKQLGIQEKVLFEPYCKNPFPYYKLADIMVLSTEGEGLPNVVLESMTLGLPVVSTDCLSGPLELIKGSKDYSKRIENVEICERGILVPKKDSDTTGETSYLADGVKLLLADSKLCECISVNQRKYMENYDNGKILEAWLSVIEGTKSRKKTDNEGILSELKHEKKLIIYGAGIYGNKIMNYILSQGWQYDFLCFAVTDKEKNLTKINSIPVFQIDDLLEYKDEALVVVGTTSAYEGEIKNKLDQYGFRYVFSDLYFLGA